MDDQEWTALMNTVAEVSSGFPDAIMIGGIAVWAQCVASGVEAYADRTHDADLAMSRADYGDLKDIEAVTPNRRLSKAQFVKNGFEFDVYVEGSNDLPVPYDELAAWSEMTNEMRVSCIEHLIVLKAGAHASRGNTPKGVKDEDDTLRLLLAATRRGMVIRPEAAARFDHAVAALIRKVMKGDSAHRLASGNRHEAALLRQEVAPLAATATALADPARAGAKPCLP